MKYDILTVLFWVSLAILIIWTLGKMFGFIHTAPIIEFLPYLALGVSIGTAYQKFSNVLDNIQKELGTTNEKTDTIETDLKNFERKLIKMEAKCEERHK